MFRENISTMLFSIEIDSAFL